MKESRFLGTLLPVHPDFIPIVQAIREKYSLAEINPDDEPITEVYLGDEIIPLDEFYKDVESRVRENLNFLPPEMRQPYLASRAFLAPRLTPLQYETQIEAIPDDSMKGSMVQVIDLLRKFAEFVVQMIDPMVKKMTEILCLYLLAGESDEIPDGWIGNVATITSMNEAMVFVMASRLADPDVIVQQFREEYRKNFGEYHPRMTPTVTGTAYYLQLKRAKKPWNYIVEEFIRLEKISLPRDRTSKRYQDVRRKVEQQLKKRIQRTEKFLDALLGDKKQ